MMQSTASLTASPTQIDVIGEGYPAAANFAERQPADHAARTARLAVDPVAPPPMRPWTRTATPASSP